MIIKKRVNEYGSFDIEITSENKTMSMFQMGQDHAITCGFKDYRPTTEISFVIGTEEPEVFEAFSKLYESITRGYPLGCPSDEETDINDSLVNTNLYRGTVQDGVISIMSDNTPTYSPNILKISKLDNSITLFFHAEDGRKMHVPKNPFRVEIGIRQSGSRLYEFAIPFKTLFKDLGTLKPHVDESESPKKLINNPLKKD